MFQTKVVEKIKTDILCLTNFCPESRAVYERMQTKYFRARQAIDDSMAHAHYMLDN